MTPLERYCCLHCGFWQPYFERPPGCPVCLDYRHPLPADGWRFETPGVLGARVATRWAEAAPGLWRFWNEPAVGIGPSGYVLVRADGNAAFEGATWYDDAALDFVASLGGVRWASASHAHVFGGLWRLAERFGADVVIQEAELPFARALPVAWSFGGRADLGDGLTLVHTGGHTPGHAVLLDRAARRLFVGDMVKFRLDSDGRAVGISAHRAYDSHIPPTLDDVRRYERVVRALDFEDAVTPWEVVPGVGRAAIFGLFETMSRGRPFADFLPVDPETGAPTADRPDPSLHPSRGGVAGAS